VVAEGDMDKLREIFVFVCFAMGVCALILTVYQGWSGKVAPAIILGMTALGCGSFLFLSQIKVLKLWEFQVELRETIDRAEEILGKLRRLSVISAKSSYTNLAWSNRFGGPSAKDKQLILDEVDQQLAELKVTPDERANVVRPYVHLIGWDFYQMYIRTLDRYVGARYGEFSNRANSKDLDPAIRAEIERRGPLVNNWRARIFQDGLYARAQGGAFPSLLDNADPGELFDNHEKKALAFYRKELSEIFEGCVAKGGFTKEATEYFDKYNDLAGYDKKITELFGYNPSELR
jgi:hypothetical protein